MAAVSSSHVPLASDPKVVRANVELFDKILPNSRALQAHLSYFRGWYAFRRDDGSWAFGPSKFIGYEGMTAPIYLAAAKNLNGRVTEAHLKRWFKVVDENTPLYDELRGDLYRFVGQFGKAPSTAMRLSVLNSDAEAELSSASSATSPIIPLIVAVARTLTPAHRAELKASLATL